jgi:hypothetical protein
MHTDAHGTHRSYWRFSYYGTLSGGRGLVR